MESAWFAAVIAVTVPTVASAAPDPSDAVPASCERLQAVLGELVDAGGRRVFYRGDLDAVAPEACRNAIDEGQWPGLVRILGGAKDTTLRKVLCVLAPPGAIPIATKWLIGREQTGDDAGCALMVLRGAPDAFQRIASERFVFPGEPPSTDLLVGELSDRMTPEERVWLLPALEFMTKNEEEGRDVLYARVCVTPRAKAAHACADFPPKLNTTWARRAKWEDVGPWYAGNVMAALAYASWGIIANRRHPKEMTWRLPGLGAAAVFVLATWLIVVSPPHGEGGLHALDYLLAVVLTLPAIAGGYTAAWAAVRFFEVSPVSLCVTEAVAYVVLAVLCGTRQW